ncbi:MULTISPECIES: hypothetical protein [unclassified Rhodanobacter]|uniref:hypothetical protein n=1 Tax=unclassified Rhodanobacter TaxID=2621553 RepID=UPI000AFCABE5|nr:MULTISPECIES: hypothetical protein [unclassified Rhodanobacter]
MNHAKFDETDRRAVVDVLSKQLGTTLAPVGSRRKWFKDEAQRSYWIIGGYEDWHGIPAEMMDAEADSPTAGILVIALRQIHEIRIYAGLLAPLVEAREKLMRALKTSGDYQLTYTNHDYRYLVIDQAPHVVLSGISGFSFGEEEKTSVARLREAEKLLMALPADELHDLLVKFHADKTRSS